jgi:hypothetical protein
VHVKGKLVIDFRLAKLTRLLAGPAEITKGKGEAVKTATMPENAGA